MKELELKIKKLAEEATLPAYAEPGDAGLDFTALEVEDTAKYIEYRTGIAVEIPTGHVGLLFPRSSVSNTDLMLANAIGVVDENYRGEIIFRFKKVLESGAEDLSGPCETCEGIGVIFSDNEEAYEGQCPDCQGEGELIFIDMYEVGDRIGQMIIMPFPKVKILEVQTLSSTSRNTGAFGSTGK